MSFLPDAACSAESGIPAAATELSQVLDQTIDALARDHAALIRKACSVAPEVGNQRLRSVVVVTLFGHTTALIRRTGGTEALRQLFETLVEQLEETEPFEPSSGQNNSIQ